MTDIDSRNLEVLALINKLSECSEMFTTLKDKYGNEFCATLPLDKNILRYFNVQKKEKKKDKEKTYGEGSNNHGTRWTETDKSILHEMFNQDKTVHEIGKYLGRTDYSIECVLISEELIDAVMDDNDVYYVKRTGKKSWTLYEVRKLIELFEDDISPEDIAKKLSGFRKNNKLTEDDILEKLEQLGLIEIEEEPT